MKIALVLSCIALLTACDNATNKAEKFAEGVIGSNLKDPHSARFSSLVTYRIKQGAGYADLVHVCGLVNAKNNFGGYAGNSRFVVSFLDGKQPELISKALEEPDRRTSFESVYWNDFCSEKHS
ncbi:hypothetical protein [Serratia ficaria]|uniref:hypothetical protein n=1 Tax=Serratia ficaria TaxID=61651 RepID=UPI0021B743FD|nr:hypothetical protein [Serratia ficaria]